MTKKHPSIQSDISTTSKDTTASFPTKGIPMPSSIDQNDMSDLQTLKETVYSALLAGNKPLRLDSIIRMLKLQRREKKLLESTLTTLEDEGRLIKIHGAWVISAKLPQENGVVHIDKNGMTTVHLDSANKKIIYIPAREKHDAWHGDTVSVLILPKKHKGILEGRILEILTRPEKDIPVTAQSRQSNGEWYCVPVQPQTPASFLVSDSQVAIEPNDLLIIKPIQKIGFKLWTGTVISNLAGEMSPTTQEMLCKIKYGIPTSFSEEVLKSASRLPESPEQENFKNRKDLRQLPFVTIDGSDAKDFDDAIYVEPKKQTGSPSGAIYTLYVAIADVAHYVQASSAIDAEAFRRGNSYYFPASVEPMLPETLSNGLCSLRPNEPRLVMVAELSIDAQGKTIHSHMYSAVISSKARLTYDQVKELVTDQPENNNSTIPSDIIDMLTHAAKLASLLEKMHSRDGALSFSLPEAVITVEKDAVTSIRPREQHFAHKLIEYCMIAANEAVASFLTKKKVPVLYRVHPIPSEDKMNALLEFLRQAPLPEEIRQFLPKKKNAKPQVLSSNQLQKILQKAQNLPQSYVLNKVILRSMMQAQYSLDNDGHYGLASACYCHFTSPIRRYSDLIIHRTLKAVLENTPSLPYDMETMQAIAQQVNITERRSVEAEREIDKRCAILFLQDKIGEEFSGTVSGVTEFGIFVELTDFLTEGIILLSFLKNDYYLYNQNRHELRGQNTGFTFSIGQPLRVTLAALNLHRLEITLVPSDAQFLSGKKTSRKQNQSSTANSNHKQNNGSKSNKFKSRKQKRTPKR